MHREYQSISSEENEINNSTNFTEVTKNYNHREENITPREISWNYEKESSKTMSIEYQESVRYYESIIENYESDVREKEFKLNNK